ncbi:hypothetical protein VTN00DRAFT_407 [Thermoascus crustaceus]|uniref:uncharacterized protein n=1 Tax=Thermoascus crustaceus TaxID=5088 RepID=UPI0037423322
MRFFTSALIIALLDASVMVIMAAAAPTVAAEPQQVQAQADYRVTCPFDKKTVCCQAAEETEPGDITGLHCHPDTQDRCQKILLCCDEVLTFARDLGVGCSRPSF